MATDDTDLLGEAASQARNGDPQAAARSLRFAAQSPKLHTDDARLGSLIDTVARIAGSMNLDDLAHRATGASGLVPQALYDLGYELVEVGLPAVAVPVFQRVHRVLPGQAPVVSELASALERAGRHAEARDVLMSAPELLEDFWLRYLVVFNALCAGDLVSARTHEALLSSEDPSQAHAQDRVAAMLSRAARLEVQGSSEAFALREWQYILNGYVLHHLSPFGWDEGMRGRYAYSQDGLGAIRRDLDSLADALRATDTIPPRVLWLPERGSKTLALALADLLRVPSAPWSQRTDGLVVAYDLADLDEESFTALAASEALHLFSRTVRWTEPSSLVPSHVGLLAQTLIAPWSAGLRMAPGGGVEQTPESVDPPEQWARQVLDADVGTDEVAPGDTGKERLRFVKSASPEPSDMFLEGPIRSSRFG
ncbi:MAG: hypothetical protein KDA24_21815 [Deltaproteobacteria bacterium]|nr:hypothetical protein [Deltaproteobacteria bacterium]